MTSPRTLRPTGITAPLFLLAAIAALLVPATSAATESEVAELGAAVPSVSAEESAVELLSPPSESGCPGDPEQPFLPWGDNDTYTLAPGGSFEGSETDWFSEGGAYVAEGNEPWYVGGEEDNGSLVIPDGGSVTSVPVCITRDFPTFRVFGEGTRSSSARLRVESVFRDARGKVHSPRVGTLFGLLGSPEHGWQVSPTFPVIANLFLAPGQTGEVAFRFTAKGDWSLDDVYVDPRHRS